MWMRQVLLSVMYVQMISNCLLLYPLMEEERTFHRTRKVVVEKVEDAAKEAELAHTMSLEDKPALGPLEVETQQGVLPAVEHNDAGVPIP